MADIQVANTDADLSGNTVVTEENAYTITGLHTFDRDPNAPFAVVSGSAVVANLDADKVDGVEAAALLRVDGSLALSANWDAGGYEIRAATFESDVTTGTAPLTIASTTLVTNLNADKLDSQEGTYYLAAANATGTLAVNQGGTGATSLTDGGVLLGSGTGAITAMTALADGEMIVGDGSTDPVAESGATLRTSIGVGTGDSPQFTGLTISGTGASALDVGGGINAGTGDVALVGTDGRINGPLSSTIIDDLSGANLTSLAAGNISSGTVGTARLGSGTASSSTFLRGDSSWAAVATKTPHVNEGRLTLTSGTAVTTADVTGAGTVYFALDKGDQIALYDGSSAWETVVFSEMSIALSGGTASRPNDIFLDYNGGSPALAILAWSNDTSRATALTKQNGVWVKTGDTQQRYLGTVYLDGSNQCEDSNAKRHCWNLENQRIRPLKRIETTDSWTYTTASYRQANGSTSNQVEVVLGIASAVEVILTAISANSGNGRWRMNAIGLDGTNANGITGRVTETAGEVGMTTSAYNEITAIGRHYLAWLEMSSAGDTTTWYGDNGGTSQFSGLVGSVMG
jgi:hypothetical protein